MEHIFVEDLTRAQVLHTCKLVTTATPQQNRNYHLLLDEETEPQGDKGFPSLTVPNKPLEQCTTCVSDTKDSPAIISWTGGDPGAGLGWKNVDPMHHISGRNLSMGTFGCIYYQLGTRPSTLSFPRGHFSEWSPHGNSFLRHTNHSSQMTTASTDQKGEM